MPYSSSAASPSCWGSACSASGSRRSSVTSGLNILWLGLKEIRSLLSDFVMVIFVVYAFTLAIYSRATGTSSEVNNASIAFVDEDGSPLSKELFNAFYPPRFKFPDLTGAERAQDE